MNLIQYRFDYGSFTALVVSRGRKYISIIPLTAYGETGMKVVKLPLAEERRFRPVKYKGKPYPLARAVRKFKHAYRTFGGTKAVKSALYA